MQTQKIIETTDYTYIISYNPTRMSKKGVWEVKRISNANPIEFKIANSRNNPTKTIDNALTEYETLIYNYLSDLE